MINLQNHFNRAHNLGKLCTGIVLLWKRDDVSRIKGRMEAPREQGGEERQDPATLSTPMRWVQRRQAHPLQSRSRPGMKIRGGEEAG